MGITLYPHQEDALKATAGKTRAIHGLRHSRLYSIWANMKTRCYNVNDPHYQRWGGKGVQMCDDWRNNFKSFYDWSMSHGYADDLTIDRIDGRGGYEPSNCRWVTIAENNRNKPNVRHLTYNGKTQTIGQWTKELGLGKETIRERLKRGWSEQEAIEGKKVMNP